MLQKRVNVSENMDEKDEKDSSVKEEAALKMVDFSTDSKSAMHHEVRLAL